MMDSKTSNNRYGHPMPEASGKPEPPSFAAAVDGTTLQEELAAKTDSFLRLAADFDNFKKRTLRETEEKASAEKESFIRDLLPVLDNLERALACEPSASAASFHQGVEMTRVQLSRLLQTHGIEPVEDVGGLFDVNRHDALSMRHDPTQPDQSVLEVVLKGYCRGEKVFRPAQVIVNDLSHPERS